MTTRTACKTCLFLQSSAVNSDKTTPLARLGPSDPSGALLGARKSLGSLRAASLRGRGAALCPQSPRWAPQPGRAARPPWVGSGSRTRVPHGPPRPTPQRCHGHQRGRAQGSKAPVDWLRGRVQSAGGVFRRCQDGGQVNTAGGSAAGPAGPGAVVWAPRAGSGPRFLRRCCPGLPGPPPAPADPSVPSRPVPSLRARRAGGGCAVLGGGAEAAAAVSPRKLGAAVNKREATKLWGKRN